MKQLIVIDMQNDFVTGALANKSAEMAIPHIVNAIKESEFGVIFTKDTHYSDYSKTLEGQRLKVPHCIKGTEGHSIVPEIAKVISLKDTIVEKNTFGYADWAKLFGGNPNQPIVKDSAVHLDIDELLLMGTVMPICPFANPVILRALYPNTKITVDFRGCGFMGKDDEEIAKCKEICKYVLTMQQIDIIE